ncbi:tRNA(His) guanylyltransferase Thg1 family protein [Dactylosporangium salmoneum]|uniref:tRNAHis guanylyltransferase catalytic domain-containing protein n=1 Tax=Dactylosporangium salmoneum TaxID=53361 RepID=A0ABN3G4Z8_9ACTN
MSTDRDGLGDRMKAHERVTRTVLPRRTYTVLRVDGRAFHSYLRGAARPYDERFMADMDAVAQALCAEIAGAAFAYVQSDEVSVLACDFASPGTEPWFGGEVQKWCSVAASVATATLNRRRTDRPALFDARVFTITDPAEVAGYFIWRQRDAVRNSIAMAAQTHFPPKRLHGVNSAGMQELLWSEKSINWNDYPPGCKRGRVVVRASGEREVTFVHTRTRVEETVVAMRSWWEARPAPHFTTNPGTFLPDTIPPYPAPAAQ